MEGGTTGSIHFLNLEYFFRLLYNSRLGITGEGTEVPFTFWNTFVAWLGHFWATLGAVSFLFSLLAFAILAYATVRLYQLKEEEEHANWSDLNPEEAEHAKDRSRWAHVQALIESPEARDWREAVMEADIMLEDLLIQRGFPGETTGERLQHVSRDQYRSLDDAWEAHKVRNQVAHEGSAFELTDKLAYRTIKKYENVFREFGEI